VGLTNGRSRSAVQVVLLSFVLVFIAIGDATARAVPMMSENICVPPNA